MGRTESRTGVRQTHFFLSHVGSSTAKMLFLFAYKKQHASPLHFELYPSGKLPCCHVFPIFHIRPIIFLCSPTPAQDDPVSSQHTLQINLNVRNQPVTASLVLLQKTHSASLFSAGRGTKRCSSICYTHASFGLNNFEEQPVIYEYTGCTDQAQWLLELIGPKIETGWAVTNDS